MSLQDRIKATAKNVEGKLQEGFGELTGNAADKAEGKAKQVDASVQHAKTDVKETVQDTADSINDRANQL